MTKSSLVCETSARATLGARVKLEARHKNGRYNTSLGVHVYIHMIINASDAHRGSRNGWSPAAVLYHSDAAASRVFLRGHDCFPD